MVDIVAKWSASNITSPAYTYAAITPSDTVDESKGPFKAFFCGVAGNVAIVGLDNVAVTLVGCVAGAIYPLIGRRVNATNTTATSLVALR